MGTGGLPASHWPPTATLMPTCERQRPTSAGM
jgi:hypothetical protein